MSNTISNEILSPVTFLKKKLYENIPEVKYKRVKIKTEDFVVPSYEDYFDIAKFNYNVAQLKSICKYYNLKKTGNKQELLKRVYNYLRLSQYAIIIQRNFRRHMVSYYMEIHGPAFHNRSMCVNDTDFFTLDSIEDIPHYQFISFTDENDFTYGFDVCSLFNLVKNQGIDCRNPYTRIKLPTSLIYKTNVMRRLCKILHYPLSVDIDINLADYNEEQKVALSINSVFQQIDELGNYSNADWLMNLEKPALLRYIKELYDIWSYRAQLTHEVKTNICHPTGNPFRNMPSYNNLVNRNITEIRKHIVTIIENLITTGVDTSSKGLGAYYVLAALTIVSPDAASALPWLYESVS